MEDVKKQVEDLTDLELAQAYPQLNRIIAQCRAELEAVTVEVDKRKQRVEKPDDKATEQ